MPGWARLVTSRDPWERLVLGALLRDAVNERAVAERDREERWFGLIAHAVHDPGGRQRR